MVNGSPLPQNDDVAGDVNMLFPSVEVEMVMATVLLLVEIQALELTTLLKYVVDVIGPGS
jgi:hypothetical protein